jgi:hypothetical protein
MSVPWRKPCSPPVASVGPAGHAPAAQRGNCLRDGRGRTLACWSISHPAQRNLPAQQVAWGQYPPSLGLVSRPPSKLCQPNLITQSHLTNSTQSQEVARAAEQRTELEAAKAALATAQTAGAMSAMARRVLGGTFKHAFFAFQQGPGSRWDPFMLLPWAADAFMGTSSDSGLVYLEKGYFKSKGGQALCEPVYSRARWDALVAVLQAHGYVAVRAHTASSAARCEVMYITWA